MASCGETSNRRFKTLYHPFCVRVDYMHTTNRSQNLTTRIPKASGEPLTVG